METTKITLTKEEVDSLKQFCDDNLTEGCVEVIQGTDRIGFVTKVQTVSLPRKLANITDYEAW